jgi:hypothetical protein
VTAYDRVTHALIRNMPRASRSSQIPEMQKNSDGSVNVYFGPAALAGKGSNWVPTGPKRSFEVMFRAYAPTKAFFERRGSCRTSRSLIRVRGEGRSNDWFGSPPTAKVP